MLAANDRDLAKRKFQNKHVEYYYRNLDWTVLDIL